MQQSNRIYLPQYRDIIGSQGEVAVRTRETLMASDGRDEVYYIPFEWTNPTAKLVVVGITPGPTQLIDAYRTASSKIKVGLDDEGVLKAAKIHAAFGGPSMRPNLVRMMNHFGFAELFGVDDVLDFWGASSDIFLGTSVVPHAAFRNGKPFAGSFSDVMASRVLADCFLYDFVTSLKDIPDDAKFVGLGETPLRALSWCVSNGKLREEQVLGAFAHPSTNGGTAVDAYLGLRTEFNEKDPVRHRAARLRMYHDGLESRIDMLMRQPAPSM